MKSLKNIAALFIIVIFMVPAAGVYYTLHSCKASGTTTLALSSDYSCCAEEPLEDISGCCDAEQHCNEEAGDPKNEPLNCCGPQEEDCCTNDGKYLKTEDTFTSPAKVFAPQIEIQIRVASLLAKPALPSGGILVTKGHPPPLLLSSREILIHKSSFLI